MADTRNIKITLTVPEELVDLYTARSTANGTAVNALMVQTLKSAANIKFEDRPLIINKSARLDIEAIAETSIETEAQLVALLKNLLRIDMGEVTVFLTERQADKFHEFSTYFDEPINEYMSAKLTDAINYVLGEW